jgi:hypothetical protein
MTSHSQFQRPVTRQVDQAQVDDRLNRSDRPLFDFSQIDDAVVAPAVGAVAKDRFDERDLGA